MNESSRQSDENQDQSRNVGLSLAGRKRKHTLPQAKPDGNKRKTQEDQLEYVGRLEKEVEKLRAESSTANQFVQLSSNLVRANLHMSDLLTSEARLERETLRRTLQEETERLGRLTGTNEWTGGKEEQELFKMELEVDTVKRLIDEFKGKNKKKLVVQPGLGAVELEELEYSQHLNREMLTHFEHLLKRKETEMTEREVRLHTARILLQKQMRAYRSQEVSNFGNYMKIGKHAHGEGRYILLNMLGKGGFSEVFKGYDLEQHKYVAVKIHELRKDMTEDGKENYVRHVLRECEIQRQLKKHGNIVGFIDAFAINEHTYCHIMDYAEGVDLDTWLKAHGPMLEKEARGIVVQIWNALRYMNTGNRRICHYDLKPGNIIYGIDGFAKIMDFGLAKIHQASSASDHTFDLTSQGAGTYYYLPPECFMGGTLPTGNVEGSIRVSNKIDVWSVGCIFYELLYNRKAFGHGQSQEMIFRQGLLRDLTNKEIDDIFPKTPKVSREAKEYIRSLLTVDRVKRPDIFAASNDPYLRKPQ